MTLGTRQRWPEASVYRPAQPKASGWRRSLPHPFRESGPPAPSVLPGNAGGEPKPKEAVMKDSRNRGARLALTPLLLAFALAAPAKASSHREAPGIANDPVADNTDVY